MWYCYLYRSESTGASTRCPYFCDTMLNMRRHLKHLHGRRTATKRKDTLIGKGKDILAAMAKPDGFIF